MTKKSDTLDGALVVAGTERQPFVVGFSEYEGSRLLDVRKYYKDRHSGELKPTRKGVALTRVQYEVLQNTFLEKGTEIDAWFSSNEDDRSRSLSAADEYRFGVSKVNLELAEWRGLEMFKFRKEGKDTTLLLNVAHTWVSRFLEINEIADLHDIRSEVFLMFLDLISALFQSIALIDSRNEDANEVVDTIIGNWGIFSKRYVQEA